METADRDDFGDQQKLHGQYNTERTFPKFDALELIPTDISKDQIDAAGETQNTGATPAYPPESQARLTNQRRRDAGEFATANGRNQHDHQKIMPPTPMIAAMMWRKTETL